VKTRGKFPCDSNSQSTGSPVTTEGIFRTPSVSEETDN